MHVWICFRNGDLGPDNGIARRQLPQAGIGRIVTAGAARQGKPASWTEDHIGNSAFVVEWFAQDRAVDERVKAAGTVAAAHQQLSPARAKSQRENTLGMAHRF